MALGKAVWCGLGALLAIGALYAYQRPFREYPGREYGQFPLPPDFQEKTEYVFARLMYPPFGRGGRRRGFFGGGGGWSEGYSSWTTDYPRSDRHFLIALRRLTRVHARSVEQAVNLDQGDQYDWPWMYGVEVGQWALTDEQAQGLREYLLRGGFLMLDDFHGSYEWEVFQDSMRRVFPDRSIVEIPGTDELFHSLYDLDDRFQVPGAQFLYSGQTWEGDGVTPHWRGIYDDKGRLMVAMNFNMDLGDSWEWADDPEFPEKYSGMGIRIAVNHVVYAMTH